jgi:site-specific DNA recombinase
MLLAAGQDAERVVRTTRPAYGAYPGAQDYRPQRAGGYVRISEDPFGLERGVTRQMHDIKGKADHLGWQLAKFYIENDRSAYRKKRITLPDGSVVWRVVRPEFRQMLKDLFAGVIDGIIVYDQDRLLRQPRDLEDLIDIVEAVSRPVTGITSSINLMTSEGRATARMMAAMALKSSEDTARRVSRAKLQDALDGNLRTGRRFGKAEDGSVIDAEKQAARNAAAIVLATGKWCRATKYLEKESGVRPIKGGRWHDNTVRNMLLNPSIAGISVYRGTMRGNVSGKMNAADPQADAVRDVEGNYVITGEAAILDVETWEALCKMARDAHEGKTPGVARAKLYMLSGLLRCGNVRADGTVCGRNLVGVNAQRPTKANPDKHVVIYKCPTISQGGCAGVSRNAKSVDDFVEELFFKYLASKAPKRSIPARPAETRALSEARARLKLVQERLADLRRRYAEGDPKLSADSYYATLPELESSVRTAQAKVAELEAGTPATLSAKDVAEEWAAADTAGKRMILARYLHAIEIKPSKSKGLAPFDATAIKPVWRQQPTRQDTREPVA